MSIGERQQELLLESPRRAPCTPCRSSLELLDLGTLGIIGTQGVEAHGHELDDSGEMVMPVVLPQLGRRVAGRLHRDRGLSRLPSQGREKAEPDAGDQHESDHSGQSHVHSD